jgi:aspartokinase/homoserine dehydrogenase 1
MLVQKFGGSSVEDAGKIRQVAEIALSHRQDGRIAIVLSAMKGITDLLLGAAREAESGKSSYKDALAIVELRHREAAADLTSGPTRNALEAQLDHYLKDLRDLLYGVELVKECSKRTLDLVAGFGERLSCLLMASHLTGRGEQAHFIDASKNFILTNDNHGEADVDFEATYAAVEARLRPLQGVMVITGFVASTPEGRPTTLGRNGSDYTASLVGAAIRAEAVEIWKDVDGVLTADPRFVKGTIVLDEISMEEAMELSYFGAKVIHPSTMMPLLERGISLRIKNTLNPAVKGTLIRQNPTPHTNDITGIASISAAALINIEGSGMIGIPGFASRVFGALARVKVNVIMISQASSEHSICIVCRETEAQTALVALRAELAIEHKQKKLKDCELLTGLEIIAVIGENMRGRPGITGRLFSSLGDAKVNVLAIAQGSSERNISFVIESKDREKALNTVHAAFIGPKAAGQGAKK